MICDVEIPESEFDEILDALQATDDLDVRRFAFQRWLADRVRREQSQQRYKTWDGEWIH